MRAEQLDQIMRSGEGQAAEFKTSFSEWKEAVQTLVAFANAQGGRVFIGVKDDGAVVGLRKEIGRNTLENFAADIRDHTYPSLPAFVERLGCDGEQIVMVEVAADTPPLMGVYLYSTDRIPVDKPVNTEKLEAYRRVGRVNQKEDFMRMRSPQPSDPKLRIALWDVRLDADEPGFQAVLWVEQGSPVAHDVVFSISPIVGRCSDSYDDFPFPGQRSEHRRDEIRPDIVHVDVHPVLVTLARPKFACPDLLQQPPGTAISLAVTYKDDWGLTWQSARRLDLAVREKKGQKVRTLVDAGEFSRRVVAFPPKRQ